MSPAIDALGALLGALVIAAPSDTAALNFVNATGLPGKIEIRIDGEPLSRNGYSHGDFSGGLLFPADKPIPVEASAPACEPAPPLRMLPANGATSIIVLYATPAPDGAAFPLALRARILPHREPSARRSVTAIYLGVQPFVIIRSGDQDIEVQGDTPTEVWSGAGATFTAALPHGTIAARLDETGHYWLIVHDQEGKPSGHLLVPDPAYSIPVFDPPQK